MLAHVLSRKNAEELIADNLLPPALRKDGFAAGEQPSLSPARAQCSRTRADGPPPPGHPDVAGPCPDDGGSLRIGFEALLTQSVNEGRARQALADDLQVRPPPLPPHTRTPHAPLG